MSAPGAVDARPSGPADGPPALVHRDRSPYVGRPTASPDAAASWTARRLAVVNLRAIVGRAYPRIIGARREPSWVIFEVGMPLLTTSAFVLVYRALGAPSAFVGFVVIGGAMTAFWLNVIWMMAGQLYWERGSGNLELYFTAPIHMMSILFGMAIGGLFMSGVRGTAVIVVASLLFDVHYAISDGLLLVVVFLLTMFALYGLGMLLASLFLLWGREAWHLVSLFQEPIYFLGGLYSPLRALGPLAAIVAGILPLAVGLDAIRQLALAGSGSLGFLPPGVETAIVAVMAVAFLVLARFALAYIERLARREGRLTAPWQ